MKAGKLPTAKVYDKKSAKPGNGETITPASFMHIAEEHGLLGQIDHPAEEAQDPEIDEEGGDGEGHGVAADQVVRGHDALPDKGSGQYGRVMAP